jgi:hypothetical protein
MRGSSRSYRCCTHRRFALSVWIRFDASASVLLKTVRLAPFLRQRFKVGFLRSYHRIVPGCPVGLVRKTNALSRGEFRSPGSCMALRMMTKAPLVVSGESQSPPRP